MPALIKAEINCDMGESYGNWTLGDDATMMQHVTRINVACGEHAGDFDVMDETVQLAKVKGVLVGAHPSFPGESRDLVSGDCHKDPFGGDLKIHRKATMIFSLVFAWLLIIHMLNTPTSCS